MNAHTFSILTDPDILRAFFNGLATTIELFFVSGIFAYLLGCLLAVLRMSGRAPSAIVAAFVEYHRNVPSIVQFLVWYFGVPQIFPASWQSWANAHASGFAFAVIALALNAAAYISEDLRSGFRAVSYGQMEAARALGMNYLRAMRLVLVPQAIRNALPALVNQALSLLKTTSLAMAIGVSEIMYVARQVDGETYATFAAYLVPTVAYLACTLSIMLIGNGLQRHAVMAR